MNGIIGWPSAFAKCDKRDFRVKAGITSTAVVLGDSGISLAADSELEETTLSGPDCALLPCLLLEVDLHGGELQDEQ